MEKSYIDLVRLLIEAAPSVFDNSPFAMKGGTAINLFVANMPRLSVDIDLVFADHRLGRNEALQSIADALASTRAALMRQGIEADVVASKSGEESKLFIRRGVNLVKIEANHVFRGAILPTEVRALMPAARSLFATGLSVRTLAGPELYGSKLVAAMDRQHPRDLFDVHGLYADTGITSEIVECFVCYLAGHNRPVHEVLFSRPIEIAAAFENEFQGMTRDPVTLNELLAVRQQLQNDLPKALTAKQRDFLLGFVGGEPDWSLMSCPHLSEMPAIRWKLQNLAKLKKTNPGKFALQAEELQARFEA